MKPLRYFIGAFISAAFLASCSSAGNGITSLAPSSIAPQSVRSQPALRQVRKNGVTETVLYSFASGSDGAYPGFGSLTNVNGTLFGTTQNGGASGDGTVFEITTAGAYSQLYSFAGGSDGAVPLGHLTYVNGTLYGTTYSGGGGGSGSVCGTVFKVTTSGTESVLHNFTGSDGCNPYGGLLNVNGTLYGTTAFGGTHGYGTAFKITTSGVESVLYSFDSFNGDGFTPTDSLTKVAGPMYGTSQAGGAHSYGTVFKIGALGAYSELYSFAGGSDGGYPVARLTEINGILYGTTSYAGEAYGHGYGTVFKITTSGTETVLHSFGSGSDDGMYPEGDMIHSDRTLFGTTTGGGSHACGTIFRITTSGAETVLYGFAGSDGCNPLSGLIRLGSTLYGTTQNGGAHGFGAIFSLSGF